MIQKRTIVPFTVRDERDKIIGDFIINMLIEQIVLQDNNIYCEGHYYVIINNTVKKLSNIDLSFLWEEVEMAEDSFFAPITSTQNFKDVVMQRMLDFANLQLFIEMGENWGTQPEDWEDFQ